MFRLAKKLRIGNANLTVILEMIWSFGFFD